jgi:hypothetical protein
LSEVQDTPTQTTSSTRVPVTPSGPVYPDSPWGLPPWMAEQKKKTWYTDPNVLVPVAIGGTLTLYLLYRAARRK